MLNATAACFAAAHDIKLDALKRIEGRSPKFTLDPAKAREIAPSYGLQARSLTAKEGDPIMIDGKPATSRRLEAWVKVSKVSDAETARLGRAAARDLMRMFRAASKVELAIPLAAAFVQWQQDMFFTEAGKPGPIWPEFDRSFGEPISQITRKMTIDALDREARCHNSQTGMVEYPPEWIAIRDKFPQALRHSTKYEVQRTAYRIPIPILSPAQIQLSSGAILSGLSMTQGVRVQYRITGERKKAHEFAIEKTSSEFMGAKPPQS